MSSTDFNDLYLQQGPDAVLSQLRRPMYSASANDSPAPPSNEGAAKVDIPDLDEALERFAWTVPDGRIWDARTRKVLKEKQVRDWIGADVFKEWKAHEQRRTVEHGSVARAEAAAQKKGGGELAHYLARFVVLYPSQNAWDRQRCEVVALNDLKPLMHRWYTPWLEHTERQTIDKDRLVFDPQQQCDPETHINMFRGLPLTPVTAPGKCGHIFALLRHLCNDDPAVYEWLLCWLALPLQRVGTKMLTAVMMHSETQGTGKSLLFEEVMKPIYGEYAATLSQHQLESQYTGWRSKMLFGLFEEILSRDQKYSHTGTIKHMITGKTQRIEEKFITGWEEANHMNAVFLSNELQPFPVETSDRRMLVIWPERKCPPGIFEGVLKEIANGGIEAFYDQLLGWPLRWTPPGETEPVVFEKRTEPPMTDAKQRLIDFGRPSWDVFYREWRAGRLYPEFPYETCLTKHLWMAYKRWCHEFGERGMGYQRFVVAVSVRERKRSDLEYSEGQGYRKGTFFLAPDFEAKCEEAVSQSKYLSEVVRRWRCQLEEKDD